MKIWLMPDSIAFNVIYELLLLSSIGRASLSQGWIQEPRCFILVSSIKATESTASAVKVTTKAEETLGVVKGEDEIGTISTRTTKNTILLGGQPGEFGVKITYKDGSEFDMTKTRVKETEVNS
ncbi:hypothetical protein [Aeromonas caviae]|uniref:hypothetical protein n=1 Tax=Aeromonas caviae TaxID=648 RepID=UPI00313C51C7